MLRVMHRSKIIVALFLFIGGLIISQGPAFSSTAEGIRVFNSRIVVHADASMTVTETITVNSAGSEIRHGIIRDFPTTYRDRYGNTVRVGFEIIKILRDNHPEPYHTEKVSNGVKIYLGEKDVFLPSGRHTYTIVYKTDRQLGFFQDYDELYWNVTGNGWTLPIDAAQAVVELPPGTKITQYAAYTGPYGGQDKDYRVTYDTAGNIVVTTTRGLGPREGLTIAVAWPKGVVRQPSASEEKLAYFKDNAPVFAAFLGFLVLLGYYVTAWFRIGRDPKKGTIIPLFEPPKGFSPAAIRFLMRTSFDAKAFAAEVIDMAVKGFLRIKESNGFFSLEKKGAGQLFPEEQDLGRDLFDGNLNLEIAKKHQVTLASAQKGLEKSLQLMLSNIYFKTNRQFLWPGLGITGLILAALIITAEEPTAAMGILLFYVITCGLIAFFASAWQNQGWVVRIFFLFFGSVWFFIAAITGPAAVFSSGWVSIVLSSIIVLHLLFLYLLKAPTLQGRQIMNQIEGFKMYLAVAEKERLEALQPPARSLELFEKYLPYAFALDVENQWSEQFSEVLAQAAAAGQAYAPTWYEGNSWNSHKFASFADSLGTSLSDSISAAATPPSSSSGSGGGGFSGGGGGGGGGSGW
jgi:uncharacterized membrane protein YgcG